jgi:hypothetical protein
MWRLIRLPFSNVIGKIFVYVNLKPIILGNVL